MKVKIAYTVEFDEVPKLMDEFLSSVRQNLKDCAEKLNFNPNNIVKMTNDYEDVRNKLGVIDSQVQDILQIAAGWAHHEGKPVTMIDPATMEEPDDKESD